MQQPQRERFAWGKFLGDINSLRWYDLCTSFVFRFMAKTSEPLLAAGVIVSAIDFLQRGELLANNHTLSLWWSVAQGVAMEVSVGPVLLLSLEANEQGDRTKAILYASLSGTLAVVGGAMLFLQFALTVGGLHDSQISPYVIWPLFLVRTIASIGYIALSCTKHKRFSGVSPKTKITETNKVLEDAMAHFTAMQSTMEQRLAEFGSRLIQIDETTEQRLQEVQRTFVEEVSVVMVTLEQQSKVIRQLPEWTSERTVNETRPKLLPNVSPNDFDKKKFVTEYLTEHPEMGGAEIQRKAKELGYTISAGYISDIRKAMNEQVTYARTGTD